jgi:hypothetical protein
MNSLATAAILFGMFLIISFVAFHAGFKEGWIVGSACTAAANPASAGNVSIGRSACAPP